MKIWLNDLKEGDIFYHIMFNKVCKCKHLGDAHNINFKMPRIKFKILDNNDLVKILNKAFGEEREAFVNQYVYDNFDEAREELIKLLSEKIDNIQIEKIRCTDKINRLEKEEECFKKIIEYYGKDNIEKDIAES